MLLQDKTAVIYGVGPIGAAVARGFAAEGARVFLAARTPDRIEAVAADIRSAGGEASTALVDALDEQAVDDHAESVVEAAGGIDISFNLIDLRDVQGTPLAEMSLADFEQPIFTAMRTQFLTSRAAARPMIRQGSGVILFFGGHGDPLPNYSIGGFQIALGAVEYLRRQLAMELGPHGVRVVSLQTSGVVDTIPADFEGGEAIAESITESTMLKRAAMLEDVANVAVFAASDKARTLTGTAINMSVGAIVD